MGKILFPNGKKCKYCEKPARIVIIKGRNKGYSTTCCSRKCLKKNYNDNEINGHKKFKSEYQYECDHCHEKYWPDGQSQRWCKKCVPDKSARGIMQRYNISKPEILEMLNKISGICPICQINKAVVIDHCHKTNKVRGIICNGCNHALYYIENELILKRAKEYLYANA